MLKKYSMPSSRDDPLRDLEQPVVVQRLEVHREPGAHRLARLRVAEDDLARARDPVDRALASLRQLHHEQVGAALFGQQLETSVSRIARLPGRSSSSCFARSTVASSTRKPREPELKTGLKHTGRAG